jgi:hypothetical protein
MARVVAAVVASGDAGDGGLLRKKFKRRASEAARDRMERRGTAERRGLAFIARNASSGSGVRKVFR